MFYLQRLATQINDVLQRGRKFYNWGRKTAPKFSESVLLCLCFKASLSAKPFNENEFRLPFHFHANRSHFHVKGFALRLALIKRHKGTRKWPISKQKAVFL